MVKNYFFLSVAIVIAAAILGFSVIEATQPRPSVLVRGLAQREVSADLAVWRLSYSLGDDELENLQKQIKTKNKILADFLLENGLEESDFSELPAAITDTSLDMYSDKNNIKYTFIATSSFLVRSKNLSAINKAYKNALNLASHGIAIKQDYENKINYEFTALNEIKPAMIEEATLNARAAAAKFAKDSGSQVGKIKNATQGLFSIENASGGLEEKKSVRVVTQVEYFLK